MDLEEALEKIEVMYHTPQRALSAVSKKTADDRSVTYNQLPRDWCLQSLGDLVRVLANAATTIMYGAQRFAQALLPESSGRSIS